MPITWFTMQREGGLHMRPAQEIEAVAMGCPDLRIFNWDGDCAIPKSPTALLCLGIKQGDKIGVDYPKDLPPELEKAFSAIFNTKGDYSGTFEGDDLADIKEWAMSRDLYFGTNTNIEDTQ